MRLVMLAAGAAVGLSGCGKDLPLQPVSLVASNYCQIARKLTWDVRDTPATIHGIRVENAKWDRTCGPVAKADK